MKRQAQDRSKAGAPRARAVAAALALVVAAVAQAGLAQANPNEPPRRDDRGAPQQQQQQQPRRDSRWGDAADPRSFEARAEEQRRIMQENANNAEMTRRMSRMTPDERRDLRRQINEAGQQVYSLPRKR
jgi:hypothetical protein